MSKHRQIFDSLRMEIDQGKYLTDAGRLPSELALCRRWKVSRPTVARALRDLQLQGIIERRVGSGTFLKPELRPMQVTLGLLVDGLGRTEILDPLCAEITRAAQERGCGVFTGAMTAERTVDQLADMWSQQGVKGVFFAPLEHVDDREKVNLGAVASFRRAGVEVVLVDRDVTEFPRRSDCDLVGLDNFHAGYDLGRHVIDAGWDRAVFVAGPRFPASTDLRFAGLREAWLAAGKIPPEMRVGDSSDREFVRTVLCGPQDFQICIGSNDQTAARFMQNASALGKQVPGDLRMAGFDDVGFATLLATPLTTIRQPCRAIGLTCVDAMLGRLRHPELPARTLLLRGELMRRASTM